MIPCRYAILRFLPYVETGEFANVGVVLMSTAGRYFGFRLLRRRIARVTHFFDLHDHKPLREGLNVMREELERIEQVSKRYGTDRRFKQTDPLAMEALFAELVRPREALFRFDAPRALLADAPAVALGDLYGRYVERDFVTKQYQEDVLERGLRRLLAAYNLAERFVPQAVGDEQFNVKFPFVATVGDRVRVIKPLHLTHAEPAKAIDHGLQWAGRVAQLKKRNLLQGEVLFALQGVAGNDAHTRATLDVQAMLRDAGAEVVAHTEQNRILEFARTA